MYSVASTSALILLWTDESVYEGPSAKKFLKHLSLDAAVPLSQELAKTRDDIEEEITNRKYGIKKFYTDFLTSSPDSQVIILGAGLDPKSLDIAEKYPRATIFDVDMDHMDLKQKITKGLHGPENLKFCTANIGDVQQLLSVLENNGWDHNKTTLVLAEGLVYYVTKDLFRIVMRKLRHPNGGLVVEYSIPNEDVLPPEMGLGNRDFFNLLQKKLGRDMPIERYSIEDIQTLADDLKGKVIGTWNQQQMEKERKGRNQTFTELNTGVVRVSYIRFD